MGSSGISRVLRALFLLGVIACPATSRAAQISFAVIGLHSKPAGKGFAAGDPYHGKIGYGGGMMLEFSLAPWLGVETGGLYIQRKFADDSGNTLSATTLRVPLAFRIWLGMNWSIAAGAYVAPAMSDLRRPDGSSIKYDAYGWGSLDYGGLGSLRYDFGGPKFVGLFMESRYNFGSKNISRLGGGTDVRHRDVEFLLGVRFGG